MRQNDTNSYARLEYTTVLVIETVLVVVLAVGLLFPGVQEYLHLSASTKLPSQLPRNWNTLVSADDKLIAIPSADRAVAALINSKVWRVAILRNHTYRTIAVRVFRGNHQATHYIQSYEEYVLWSENAEIEIEIPVSLYDSRMARYKLPAFMSIDVRPTEQQAIVSYVREDAYGRRSVQR